MTRAGSRTRAEIGVERAQRELEEAFVARLGDEDADRAEPLPEQSHALLEGRGLGAGTRAS